MLIVTPFAGLLADRRRRRPILMAADVGRAALLALTPTLSLLGQLRMAHLYVISFLLGTLTAAFDVTYQAYVPMVVPREDLVDANSAVQASYSTAQVAGPGLGGLLVQLLSAPVALLADAGSYVVGAFALLLVRVPEAPAPSRSGERMARQILDGLRLTLRDPYLRMTALESGWFNLFEQVVLVLFLLYGTRRLHLVRSNGVLMERAVQSPSPRRGMPGAQLSVTRHHDLPVARKGKGVPHVVALANAILVTRRDQAT